MSAPEEPLGIRHVFGCLGMLGLMLVLFGVPMVTCYNTIQGGPLAVSPGKFFFGLAIVALMLGWGTVAKLCSEWIYRN